jgi:CubicO group peptidase (beta-lactamase class C family)
LGATGLKTLSNRRLYRTVPSFFTGSFLRLVDWKLQLLVAELLRRAAMFRHATFHHRSLRISLHLAATWCAVASLHSSDLPPDLDTYIESGMKEWKLPGLAIAVVKDGKPVLLKGYGVREEGKEETVDENTLFAIGSASKAFTATAMGILVDRGAIQWNTRVHELDPSLELSDPWVTKEIRISDLPSNHSGLSAISESLWYGSGFSREEIVERLKYVPFSEGFRYQYQYRNVMFLLAGQMIPKITDGQTWDDFIVKEIFTPLGMKHSAPTEEDLKDKPNMAQPHILNYDGKAVVLPYRSMHNIGPAGSIVSCVSDLVPWLKVHLGKNDPALVKPETLEYLHSAQTPMWTIAPDGKVWMSPFTLQSYCLGWVTESYEGHRLVWHNGNIDGMSAWVGMVPEMGFGVAMLSNLDDCEFRTAIFYHILNHLIRKEGKDLEPQMLERFRSNIAKRDEAEARWQELAKSPLKSALQLESYAGVYENPVMGKVSVDVSGDRLTCVRTRMQTLELVVEGADGNKFLGRHTNPNEDLRSGKTEIEFQLSDGKVTGMQDLTEGVAIDFERIE